MKKTPSPALRTSKTTRASQAEAMQQVTSVRLTSTTQPSSAKSLMSVLASYADSAKKKPPGVAESTAGLAVFETAANIEADGDGRSVSSPPPAPEHQTTDAHTRTHTFLPCLSSLYTALTRTHSFPLSLPFVYDSHTDTPSLYLSSLYMITRPHDHDFSFVTTFMNTICRFGYQAKRPIIVERFFALREKARTHTRPHDVNDGWMMMRGTLDD
jgi:hypothetical protein